MGYKGGYKGRAGYNGAIRALHGAGRDMHVACICSHGVECGLVQVQHEVSHRHLEATLLGAMRAESFRLDLILLPLGSVQVRFVPIRTNLLSRASTGT